MIIRTDRRKSRKSTSAGVLMLGNHLIKTWSTHQAVIALSSGEAEYYSMVQAGSVAGIEAFMADFGVEPMGKVAIKTDASAAIGISNRIGIGKVRHIQVNRLWLQEKVAAGRFEVIKASTDQDPADALTKGVHTHVIQMHVGGGNAIMLQDRHSLAPNCEVRNRQYVVIDIYIMTYTHTAFGGKHEH